jgi:hypothetical protein
VVQPEGTELAANRLNGSFYAEQFLDTTGRNGVVDALASADCGAGCRVVLDPTYPSENVDPANINSQQQVEDERGGGDRVISVDPQVGVSLSASAVSAYTRRSAADFSAANAGATLTTYAQEITENAMTGGNNLYPSLPAPYFKSTYGTLNQIGNYFTQGQHVQQVTTSNCWAVGDCVGAQQTLIAAGGYRDGSDEGVHQADIFTLEQAGAFTGTCASGCSTGSTSLTVNATYGAGTQGDGRYLIDLNPSNILSTGAVVNGYDDPSLGVGTAVFSGTSFPVSTFLVLAANAASQPLDIAPGTLTLPIKTSGVPAGFATNTAALPASSGLACVVDPYPLGDGFEVFEMAPFTVVDGTHLQLTLRKVHVAGAYVAAGGLCGYGVSQAVDTTSGTKQVFPVLGSVSATTLLYADKDSATIGHMDTTSTSGFANSSLTIAAIARSGNVVTVTLAAPLTDDVNGLTMTVTGVADSSYNGTVAVTTTSSNTLTYANNGPDSTSSGGTVSILTGAYALYPMAEVVSVYNPTTKAVDGLFTLAPNQAPWAAGDAVEESHFPEMLVHGDTEYIVQYTPRPVQPISAGKVYLGNMGPEMNGWQIWNRVDTTQYLGGGGTHRPPDSAFISKGVWKTNYEADAGTEALLRVHCNLHGCNRWDSAFNLFELDANSSIDSLKFDPNAHSATWNLNGSDYSFAPGGFTAGTINVGTLNATTITGGVSGGSITSGTIPAARLPIFGPSGTTHAPGAVPDPGPVAGSIRYLREDGTWQVPSGGGGSGGGAAGGDLSGAYPNPTVVGVHATGAVNLGVSSAPSSTQQLLTYGSTGNNVLFSYQCCGGSLLVFGDGNNQGTFSLSGLAIGTFGSFYAPPDHGLAVGTAGDFQVNKTGAVTHATGMASGSAGNNDLVGSLTLSAGSTSTAALTFTGTYASAPVCLVQPQNAAPATVSALGGWSAQVSATTLSITVAAAPSTTVTFGYVCVGRN